MKIQEALDKYSGMLEQKKVESARLSAEILTAHVANLSRAELASSGSRNLDNRQGTELESLILRRCKNEPIPYLLGKTEFYSVPLEITNGVFIPRPETEALVDATIALMKTMTHTPKVFEMGTGCGAITIAIALNVDDGEFWATDISSTAIQVAQHNVRKHELNNYVDLREGSLFAPLRNELSKDFDIFVSNPPYIKTGDIGKLPSQIKDFEPHIALDGGRDGMTFYKAVLDSVAPILHKGGYVLLEADPTLIPVIKTEIRRRPQFEDFKVIQDATGKDRIVQFKTR